MYNLSFGDEDLCTMIDEVKEFKRLGGDSMVEVTTFGINPDYDFLKKVSEATNVNIVCSTGYYLGHTLTDDVKNASVEDLVKVGYLYFMKCVLVHFDQSIKEYICSKSFLQYI